MPISRNNRLYLISSILLIGLGIYVIFYKSRSEHSKLMGAEQEFTENFIDSSSISSFVIKNQPIQIDKADFSDLCIDVINSKHGMRITKIVYDGNLSTCSFFKNYEPTILQRISGVKSILFNATLTFHFERKTFDYESFWTHLYRNKSKRIEVPFDSLFNEYLLVQNLKSWTHN